MRKFNYLIFLLSTFINSQDIYVGSNEILTIGKNSFIVCQDNFTNNGTVTLNSDSDEFSSIIVGGSSTGDIIYNRYVNTVGDW